MRRTLTLFRASSSRKDRVTTSASSIDRMFQALDTGEKDSPQYKAFLEAAYALCDFLDDPKEKQNDGSALQNAVRQTSAQYVEHLKTKYSGQSYKLQKYLRDLGDMFQRDLDMQPSEMYDFGDTVRKLDM